MFVRLISAHLNISSYVFSSFYFIIFVSIYFVGPKAHFCWIHSRPSLANFQAHVVHVRPKLWPFFPLQQAMKATNTMAHKRSRPSKGLTLAFLHAQCKPSSRECPQLQAPSCLPRARPRAPHQPVHVIVRRPVTSSASSQLLLMSLLKP